MSRKHQGRAARVAAGLAFAAVLAACGGGDGSNGATTSPAADTPGTSTARKVLLIGVDGATYAQVQAAMARKTMPNLARLAVMPSHTGGTPATLTAQPPLPSASWATVLTGSWANRHGIADDGDLAATVDAQGNTGPNVPSLFERMRMADGARKLGAATTSPLLPALLAKARTGSALDTAIDCAGVDRCVAEQGLTMVRAGYDLVLAQFSAPASAAAVDGYQAGSYAAALSAFDQSLGQLLDAVDARKQANAGEDWLVVVTTPYGLDRTGVPTAVPTLQNRTAFIALNQPVDISNNRVAAPVPDSDQVLADTPAEADILPTALSFARIDVAASARNFDGIALQTPRGTRDIGIAAGDYNASLVLSWTNPATAADSIVVLRDGVQVATLAGNATSFTDSNFDLPTGLHRFNYTLLRNGIATSYLAQLNYTRPMLLADSLRNQLAIYYSLDAKPPVDVKNGSTLTPAVAGIDGGSLVTDNFKTNALRVDSRTGSYRFTPAAADFALSPQFTLAFWFRTDCTQGNSIGEPVMSNKNYASGGNAGIAIGLFGSCELRFNIGSGGGKRDDINGLKVSANQWAYVALVVDATAKRFSGYIIDPLRGVQKVENKVIANTDVTKLNGLGVGWALNNDATFNYVANNAGALNGAMDFNDVAVWTRALTADELLSIDGSHKPLSSLNP